MTENSRPVARIVTPEPVVEGAGVHLRRSIGTRTLDHLDPFLLLDHFESARPQDYEAGFPYHPHRGIETVTLVRSGVIAHRDSLGHAGQIGAGDIQWMTSGSGILHEEMPQVRPEGIGGLQLWLNLPAREKMTRPKYRDLAGSRLAETALEGGGRARVHHEGAVPGDGLAERARRREQEAPARGPGRGLHEIAVAEDHQGRRAHGPLLGPEAHLALVHVGEGGVPALHRLAEPGPRGPRDIEELRRHREPLDRPHEATARRRARDHPRAASALQRRLR